MLFSGLRGVVSVLRRRGSLSRILKGISVWGMEKGKRCFGKSEFSKSGGGGLRGYGFFGEILMFVGVE